MANLELTEREKQILELYARGYNAKQIPGMNEDSVNMVLFRLRKRFKVATTTRLVLVAIGKEIIDFPQM
jgi:DNA-binding CsgD family transcriptional regulator